MLNLKAPTQSSNTLPSAGGEGGKESTPVVTDQGQSDVITETPQNVTLPEDPSYKPKAKDMLKEDLLGVAGELDLGIEVDRRLFGAVREVKMITDQMKAEGHELGYLHKLLDQIYPQLEERESGIAGLGKKTGKERIFHSSKEIIIALEVIELDVIAKSMGFAQTITNGGKNSAIVELPIGLESSILLQPGFESMRARAGSFVRGSVASLVGVVPSMWEKVVTGRPDVELPIEISCQPQEDQVLTDYWRIALGQLGGGDKDVAMKHITEREMTRFLVYSQAGLDIANQAHLSAVDLLHDPTLNSATQGAGVSQLMNLRQRMLMRELGGQNWSGLAHSEKMAVVMRAINDVGLVTCRNLMAEIEKGEISASKDDRAGKSSRIEAIAQQLETGKLSASTINQDDLEKTIEDKTVKTKIAADTKTAYDRLEELDSFTDLKTEDGKPKTINKAKEAEETAKIEWDNREAFFTGISNPKKIAQDELNKIGGDDQTVGSILYLERIQRELGKEMGEMQRKKSPYNQLTPTALTEAMRQTGESQRNYSQRITDAQHRADTLRQKITGYEDEVQKLKDAYEVAKKHRESLESERQNLIDGYFGTGNPDVEVRTKKLAQRNKEQRQAEAEETRIRGILETGKVQPTDDDKRKAKVVRRVGQIITAEEITKIRAQVTQESILKELSDPQTSYDYILNLLFNSTASPDQMIDDPGLRQDALTRAEIVMEIVRKFGLNIDQLGIPVPVEAKLNARFGKEVATNITHPTTISEYMGRSVARIQEIEGEIAKLRKKRPTDWENRVKAKNELIKKMRTEDELLLEGLYKKTLPYLRINRFKTADLIVSLIDRLGEKALSKDPFKPSYELTQPDTGFKVEKAVHLKTGDIIYTEPETTGSLRRKELHHGKISYEYTDRNGIIHTNEVIIKKPDSPATAGEVIFNWHVVLDQNLYNTIQRNFPDRNSAEAANLPLALVDKLYDPATGDLLPASSDLVDGSHLALTNNSDGDSLRNFNEVNYELFRWDQLDNLSDNYSIAIGKYIVDGMTNKQRQEALKYFAGVDYFISGVNYTVVREADGKLTITSQLPGDRMAVNREDIAVFINRYQDRWKTVNKPDAELDTTDIASIRSDKMFLLDLIGSEAQRALQRYP